MYPPFEKGNSIFQTGSMASVTWRRYKAVAFLGSSMAVAMAVSFMRGCFGCGREAITMLKRQQATVSSPMIMKRSEPPSPIPERSVPEESMTSAGGEDHPHFFSTTRYTRCAQTHHRTPTGQDVTPILNGRRSKAMCYVRKGSRKNNRRRQ